MRRGFRYIRHTADAAFFAYGSNLREAIGNSAAALLDMMLDQKKISGLHGKSKSMALSDRAANREDIVWHILQDILSIVDARKLNAYRFRVGKLHVGKGSIELSGRLYYNAANEDCSLMSLKAVTPHGLEVETVRGRCRIRVVVDV
jgi:SHS2 domain-containing protein